MKRFFLLVCFFSLGSLSSFLTAEDKPVINRRTVPSETALGHSPVQTHAGPVIHSLNPGERELLSAWLLKLQEDAYLAWIEQALRRGQPYRSFIRATVREYGLPPEIEFLPVLESEFKSYAVSSSGATGLWQFMTNSIRPYNIRLNEWSDERRDFWKATHGALAKLRDNYNELGDWLLALAAYNCGINRMKSALERAQTRDFWELAEGGYLPRETVQYIPKFLAVCHLAGYAGRYGIPLDWTPGVRWERIPLDQAVDLSLLAAEAGVPKDILLAGNAELRYGITPPGDSAYFLKVPAEYSDAIKETLARQDIKLMKFYLHTIRTGDTYYALAKHYGVSVAMIERYNPKLDPLFLRVGATVVVPALIETGPYIGESPAESFSGGAFQGVYTVQPGDSLWSISRRYNISPEALAMNNNIGLNGTLYAGTIIQVPGLEDLKEAGVVD
ncbi:MAG: transglycosylase SLT domain-containing protein [Spirochaetales bacterium]|nr:transglycosylase SLT domain-containing protein [Spirochaetales bacterium]